MLVVEDDIDQRELICEVMRMYFDDPQGKRVVGVDSGKQALALLLNPTRVDQVMAISAAGDRMPQKGTYFFPKLLAGIVLYDLDTD